MQLTFVLQFEGFSTVNEYSFLKTFQENHPIFIDNIQGAAATTLAGVLGADKLRRSSTSITQAKVLIVGADSVSNYNKVKHPLQHYYLLNIA